MYMLIHFYTSLSTITEFSLSTFSLSTITEFVEWSILLHLAVGTWMHSYFPTPRMDASIYSKAVSYFNKVLEPLCSNIVFQYIILCC